MKPRFLFTGLTLLAIILLASAYYLSSDKPSPASPNAANPGSTESEKTGESPRDAEAPQKQQINPPASVLSPASPPLPAPPAPRTFIIVADENQASPAEIRVKQKTPTTLIFRIKTLNVSSPINFLGDNNLTTGLIRPGDSGSLSFTASESMILFPIRQDGEALGYRVRIKVE